jgi:hypothetical protein
MDNGWQKWSVKVMNVDDVAQRARPTMDPEKCRRKEE